MSFNLTTSGACISKAGSRCNAMFLSLSGATMMAKWCDQAEASLSAETRRDWLNLSGSTLTNFRGILDDVVSDKVAMKIVGYDMSGYVSRTEAEILLDILYNNIQENIKVLKEQKIQEVMIS